MAWGKGHGARGRLSMLRCLSAGIPSGKSFGRDVKALPSRERLVREGARSGGTAPERALPPSWSDSSAVSEEREGCRVPARPIPARSMAMTRPAEEQEMPSKEQGSPPAVVQVDGGLARDRARSATASASERRPAAAAARPQHVRRRARRRRHSCLLFTVVVHPWRWSVADIAR